MPKMKHLIVAKTSLPVNRKNSKDHFVIIHRSKFKTDTKNWATTLKLILLNLQLKKLSDVITRNLFLTRSKQKKKKF